MSKINVVKTIVRQICKIPARTLSKTNYLITPLEIHCIIPDILDKAPELEVSVRYPSGVGAQLGNVIKANHTRQAPNCMTWDYEKKKYYTVYMCDLDQLSRKNPKGREWMQWLVTNIQGNRVCDGTLLAAYVGPWPQSETGLHRIVFLVYLQRRCEDFDEPRLSARSAQGRRCFNIKKFTSKYSMCGPIAVNFFLSCYDNSVISIMDMLRL